MIIISYNNVRKGPLKPGITEGDDVYEENVFGVAAGRQCDACRDAGFGAGKDLRA
jgi:hypothetical protein